MAKVASKRWKRATKEHKKNKQGKFDRPDGHPLNNNPKDMQNVLYDPSMEIPDDSSSKRTKGGIGSQPR